MERIITSAKQAAEDYKVHSMSALYGWFMSRPKMRDYFKLSKKGGKGCSVDDVEELLKGDTRLICLSISEPTAIDLTKSMLINARALSLSQVSGSSQAILRQGWPTCIFTKADNAEDEIEKQLCTY